MLRYIFLFSASKFTVIVPQKSPGQTFSSEPWICQCRISFILYHLCVSNAKALGCIWQGQWLWESMQRQLISLHTILHRSTPTQNTHGKYLKTQYLSCFKHSLSVNWYVCSSPQCLGNSDIPRDVGKNTCRWFAVKFEPLVTEGTSALMATFNTLWPSGLSIQCAAQSGNETP